MSKYVQNTEEKYTTFNEEINHDGWIIDLGLRLLMTKYLENEKDLENLIDGSAQKREEREAGKQVYKL